MENITENLVKSGEEMEYEKIKNMMLLFFEEMNAWEKYCNTIDESSLSYEEKKAKKVEKVTKIVDKFFTKKERKMGLPNCISYGVEGSYEYNPEEETVISIEIDKSKAIVSTKKDESELNKYILKKTKGHWLIDSKKNYSSWKGKWENVQL